MVFPVCDRKQAWLFQDLQKDSTNPEVVAAAKHFMDHYKFPVMMYVAYANGTIADKINANDFLDFKPNLMDG